MLDKKRFSRTKLSNGIRILNYVTDSNASAILVTVKAGTVSEGKGIAYNGKDTVHEEKGIAHKGKKSILGISHFIEHLMFEGTKKRNAKEISGEIEKYGGEINAATGSDFTEYFCKIQKENIDIAIDILGDMISNSTFDAIEKERKIILSEISMYHDTPKRYQWELFEKAIFNKTIKSIPAYGTVDDVKKITKEDIISYYNEMYVGRNIIITIIGPRLNQKMIKKIENSFNIKKGKKFKYPIINPKPLKLKREKRKMEQSYIIYGLPIDRVGKNHSYHILKGILGKPMSGWVFEELRLKRSIGYDAGFYIDDSPTKGFMAMYASCKKNKIKEVIKIFDEIMTRIKTIGKKEKEESIKYLIGEKALYLNDPVNIAEEISLYELGEKLEDLFHYKEKLMKTALTRKFPHPSISILEPN